ncbi:MAG: hypothetical protein ACLTUL_21800 [Blautia faecis]
MNIIPTATVLTRLGKNTMDLTRFLVLICEVRITAKIIPITTFKPQVRMA